MGFISDDMAARFRKVGGKKEAAADKELDIEEFYRIRAKILGVLIRDARLNTSRTESECARMMGVTPEVYASWEFGDQSPSLPQLEILAFYLGLPVSHFWGQSTLKPEYGDEAHVEAEYIKLRNRMLGAMLRQAREEADITIEGLAEDAGLSLERLKQYEMGDLPIPMHELNVLANGVSKNLAYFLESSGHIGELLALREEWKHFAELPDDLRQFAANPLNIGFIEIALMLRNMPADKLRNVGRSIVEITM